MSSLGRIALRPTLRIAAAFLLAFTILHWIYRWDLTPEENQWIDPESGRTQPAAGILDADSVDAAKNSLTETTTAQSVSDVPDNATHSEMAVETSLPYEIEVDELLQPSVEDEELLQLSIQVEELLQLSVEEVAKELTEDGEQRRLLPLYVYPKQPAA